MKIQEIILQKKIRADCYRLLAACFYAPQKDMWSEENVFGNLTSLLEKNCPEAAVFSRKMERGALQYTNEELQVEYARLFVGPYELQAPPYGSVYLEDGRKVMGDSTLDVVEIYRQAGVQLDREFKDLPDHIAVELEFMYYVIQQEGEALENGATEKARYFVQTREIFRHRFLGRWVGPFCRKMKENTKNEFYLALADCLEIFAAACSSRPSSTVPDQNPGCSKATRTPEIPCPGPGSAFPHRQS